MGGAVKAVTNTVGKVAAPIVKPIQSASNSVLQKTGVQDVVKNSVGIDLQNLNNVGFNAAQLNGSTGSKEFKNAAFDAAKIGAAVATAGGSMGYVAGAGSIAALSKVQAGKPLTIGDVAGAGGVGTTVDTGFGDFNFGNIKLPSFGGQNNNGNGINGNGSNSSFLGNMTGQNNGSSNSLIIGAGLIGIVAIVLIVRKK